MRLQSTPPSLFALSVALLACSLLASAPARALTYLDLDDAALADRATAIAEIDVLSRGPAIGSAAPSTDYVVLVERLLKGELDSTAVIRVLGGERADGVGLFVPGAPVFREGEHALVFLTPGADGTFTIRDFALGAFHRVESGGAAYAIRDLRQSTAVSRPATAGGRERDYERFATWLADRGRGVSRQLDYVRDVPAAARGAIVERFRLFIADGLNLRWFEFDGGGSVNFGFNGGAAADREAFVQGILAWNDDPGSNVNYFFLGDTPPDDFPESDGMNGVVFGDPNDEIEGSFDCREGGTLAIGGVLYDGSTGRFRNKNFVRILEAGIVVQDGVECITNSDPSLTGEFLAHELGHTLGLDHSCGDKSRCANPAANDALMRGEAHDDGRGARLSPDDRNAAKFLYPSGAGGGGGGGTGGGLAPPSEVAAEPISSTEVRVTWVDNSDGERRFRVDWSTNGRRFVAGAFAPANGTEAVVRGLPAGAAVQIRVAAMRSGSASFSEVVTVQLP